MDCDDLREIELFRDLDPLHVGHLASISMRAEIPADEVIFNAGDTPEYLYVIHRGRVRISSMMYGGDEEALAILDQGTYFGEYKLVDPSQPYPVRATAHTDCSLHLFPLDDLRNLLNTDADLAVSFLWSMVRTLAQRLQATNDKVAAMAKLTSPI